MSIYSVEVSRTSIICLRNREERYLKNNLKNKSDIQHIIVDDINTDLEKENDSRQEYRNILQEHAFFYCIYVVRKYEVSQVLVSATLLQEMFQKYYLLLCSKA